MILGDMAGVESIHRNIASRRLTFHRTCQTVRTEQISERLPAGGDDIRNGDVEQVLDGQGKSCENHRGETDFKGWHPEGAWNIPFDYILPVTDGDIRKVASSGASGVIVYGDGGEPDSGRELARELAGRGINNVSCVAGGAQALKAAREAR